jgi:dolichyl-phosphate beta-glucosyltransferase
MLLSIVIPVYNESKKIALDIEMAVSFLKRHELDGEIIVVDDGSFDQTAAMVNRSIRETEGNISFISYRPNKGKGYAVKRGILQARGDIILFIDSGNCVPYDDILPGIRIIKDGEADMAHASRYMKGSVITTPRKFHRQMFSWLFRRYIHLYNRFPRHVTDSQCGLKIYRGMVAKTLYSELITNGFLFDVEVILRAGIQGYRIVEFPIHWTPDPDSRLKPLPLLLKINRELRLIKNTVNS